MLSSLLYQRKKKRILIEGGPVLMGQFFKSNLIDEVFLTLVPKVIGNNSNTLTMVEGNLLKSNEVKVLELISVRNVESELYLRYRVKMQS